GRNPRAARSDAPRRAGAGSAAEEGRGRDVPRRTLVHSDAQRASKPAIADRRARCLGAAGAGAWSVVEYRRSSSGQADRLPWWGARHTGAPAGGRQRRRGRRVLAVSGKRVGLDGDFGRGRHHAAEIDVVRAEASRRVVDPRDLIAAGAKARAYGRGRMIGLV